MRGSTPMKRRNGKARAKVLLFMKGLGASRRTASLSIFLNYLYNSGPPYSKLRRRLKKKMKRIMKKTPRNKANASEEESHNISRVHGI
jgi:hypothetical protein